MDDVYLLADVLLEDERKAEASSNAVDWCPFQPMPEVIMGQASFADQWWSDWGFRVDTQVPLNIISVDPTQMAGTKATEIKMKNEAELRKLAPKHNLKKRKLDPCLQTLRLRKRIRPTVEKSSSVKKIDKIARDKGGSHYLHYIELKCFECNNDEAKFEAESDLIAHWRNMHFHLTESGHTLSCSECNYKFSLKKSRFKSNADVQAYISFLFTHKVKKHGMIVPNFIREFQCAHPSCRFVAFNMFSISRHIENGNHSARAPVEAVDKYLSLYGHGNKYSLIYTEFKCFLCADIAYSDRDGLLEHWRSEHIMLNTIKCCEVGCEAKYHIGCVRMKQVTHVETYIAYYFIHCTRKHQMKVPEFIVELKCNQCDFVTFTKQLLQRHMNEVKHVKKKSSVDSRTMKLCSKKHSCFICADFIDNNSVIEHFSADDHVKCIKCGYSSTNSDIHKLHQETALSRIRQLFLHYLTHHSFVPDFRSCHNNHCLFHIKRQMSDKTLPVLTVNHEDIETHSTPVSLLTYEHFKCFECDHGCEFADLETLTDHWRSHLVNEGSQAILKCKQCEYSIALNLTTVHKNHDIGRIVASYLAHLIRRHSFVKPTFVKALTCPEPECSFTCLTTKLLLSHVKHSKHHRLRKDSREESEMTMKKWKCFICRDVEFSEKGEFEDHFRVHSVHISGKYLIQCSDCDVSFNGCSLVSISSFLTHLVAKHGHQVPPYVEELNCCEADCSFTCFIPSAMQKHIRSKKHMTRTLSQSYLNFHKFCCFICTDTSIKEFKSESDLEEHILGRHVKDGGIRCPKCNHVFKLRTKTSKRDILRCLCTLLSHLTMKHNFAVPKYISSFCCTYPGCSYSTVHKYLFDRHSKSHRKDKQCYQCGLFFSEAKIERHIQKCSTMQPPQKTSQTALTGSVTELSVQSKTASVSHTAEKGMQNARQIYRCDICWKYLQQLPAIKEHIQSDHNVTSLKFSLVPLEESQRHYECMLCSSAVGEMEATRNHLLSQHHVKFDAQLQEIIREMVTDRGDNVRNTCATTQAHDIADLLLTPSLDSAIMSSMSHTDQANVPLSIPVDTTPDVLDYSMRLSGLSNELLPNFVPEIVMKNVSAQNMNAQINCSDLLPKDDQQQLQRRSWLDFNKSNNLS